jgi:hypothetical protein
VYSSPSSPSILGCPNLIVVVQALTLSFTCAVFLNLPPQDLGP